MNRFILTGWCFLVCFTCVVNAQPELKNTELLQQIIRYAKAESVNTSKLNWEVMQVKLDSLHEAQGLIQASMYLLKELDDYHGRIWYKNIPYNGIHREWTPSTVAMSDSLLEAYRKNVIPISAEVLNGNCGYVRIPGIVSSDENAAQARLIRDLIHELNEQGPLKGWIIDLRLNGGGTMFPMLVGLSPFLGSDMLGSFIDENTGYQEKWYLKNGEFYLDDRRITDYGLTDFPDLSQVPVVLLLSAATSSSGEVLAIAFKNRPNTYFIGESTAGYTTTVSWNTLSDDIVFQLTVSYYADRLNTVYKGSVVQPDVFIEAGDDFNHLEKDEKIKKSIKWFNSVK